MKANEALRKLKSGDKAAFDAFYNETHRAVYFAAYGILKDTALAEDIMQDTYVAFLNNLEKVNEERNPIAYLITMTKNKALNAAVRHRREISVDFDPEVDGKTLVSYPEYDTPLMTMARALLTGEEFRLVHMIAVEGYSKTEVAKMLSRPITTVSWQYRKLIGKLKEQYEKEERLEK